MTIREIRGVSRNVRGFIVVFKLSEMYNIHMKRTNLVLDEHLLDEATRLSGERTYSRTVERALRDLVRRVKARRILELAGSGLWEGDLATVREDRGPYRTRRRGAR